MWDAARSMVWRHGRDVVRGVAGRCCEGIARDVVRRHGREMLRGHSPGCGAAGRHDAGNLLLGTNPAY